MSYLLAIESSTLNCSVALGRQGEKPLLIEAQSDRYIHSEKLHLFIEEILNRAAIDVSELSAIAIGKGPGSYTGLRIGTSAAKGLCYSLNVPLIAVNSLQILATEFILEKNPGLGEKVVPMIDARRMEVYSAIYNSQAVAESPIEARIIDEQSFADLPGEKIHLLGDGASKCREILSSDRFRYSTIIFPSALTLVDLAWKKFENKEFEDVAYFEPFYLKEFIAGKRRKLL